MTFRAEFPIFGRFLGAYLHQDWDADYETELDALDDYHVNDVDFIKELDRVLKLSEADLFRQLDQASAFDFGDSAHDWVERLRAHIAARTTK